MRFSAAVAVGRLLPERLAPHVVLLLGRLDGLVFGKDERGQASRMSLAAFAIRILSAAIAFASQVLLARWMGMFEYGIFVLVWTAMVIAGNISCLGFHTSIIRFIPEYRQHGKMGELRGLVLASRLIVLLSAVLTATAGLLALHLMHARVETYYVAPFAIGLLALPMIALSDVLQGTSRANARIVAALTPTYVTRPLLILSFTGLAHLSGYPVNAVTVVAAALLATCTTSLVQLRTTRSEVSKQLAAAPRIYRLRHWIVVSLPIFLVEGFFFLLTNADVLMVGLFMAPGDVAVYFATVKTLALVHFVYFAVKAGVAQRYAAFAHAGDPARLATFARDTVSWTFWPSLLMAMAVLALGKWMLTLFGPGFESGYPLLFALTAGVVARSAVGPAESLLTMSGNQNVCALVYALTLALNIGLALTLIPILGLWGAALATAATMIFEAMTLAFTVWRRLGIVMTIIPVGSRPRGVR